MKIYPYILLGIAASMVLFTGCDDDKDGTQAVNVTVKSAVHDKGNVSNIFVKDNEVTQLEAFIMPTNATNKSVTYEFAGKSQGVFDMTPDGLITPLVFTPETGPIPDPLGVDTIIVRVNDGSGTFIRYPLRVVTYVVLVQSITAKDDGANPIVEKGKTFDLARYLTVLPKDALDKSVSYSSLDESVATVDKNGLITAVGEPGTTTSVVVTAKDRGKEDLMVRVDIVDKIVGPQAHDRTGWTVKTSYEPNIENPGTPNEQGRADQMLDSNNSTFYSTAKPGRPANTHVPEGTPCFFVIDMQKELEFEYFSIRHRNVTIPLRVKVVSVYGSNDGTNFTEIKKDIPVPNVDKTDLESGAITIPKTTFRYFKMVFEDWDKNNSNSMQIAEFNIGYIIPE